MLIVLFEHPRLGTVEDEMFALGYDLTECFVEHCHKIDQGTIDARRLATFAELDGVAIFRASIDDRFVIYAIEPAPPETTVTILAAGRHGVAATFGPTRWNGLDYEHLKQDVVLVRASATYVEEGNSP